MSKSIRRRSGRRHLAEALEPRWLLTAVSWDGGGGTINWHTATNWSNDQLPTINDDVTIDVPGSIQIDLLISPTIESLTLAETVVIGSGRTLTATNGGQIDGTLRVLGTLTGGTWNGGATGVVDVRNGTLDNLVMNAAVFVPDTSSLTARNHVTLNGTVNASTIGFGGTSPLLDGTGTINLSAGIRNQTGQQATIGADLSINLTLSTSTGFLTTDQPGSTRNLADIVISGPVGFTPVINNAFINEGTITASGGVILTFDTSTNKGIIDITGGKLILSGAWTSSTGTIKATNATVELGGAFNATELSSIQRFGTSTLRLVGTLTCNPTLTLNAQTGNLALGGGGVITGGTITLADGATFTEFNSVFDNVTLASSLDVGANILSARNTFTLNAALTFGNAATNGNGVFSFNAAANTLNGTGSIAAVGTGLTNIGLTGLISNPTLTIGAGISIAGCNLRIGGDSQGASITNNGSIHATVSGGTLTTGQDVTNSNPKTVFINKGTIIADAGTNLDLGGVWSTPGGTITADGANVQFSGKFTAATLRAVQRPTMLSSQIIGACDVSAGLLIDALTGAVTLAANGSLVGPGTVSGSGGFGIVAAGGGRLENGITLRAPLTQPTNTTTTTLIGTIHLDGLVTGGTLFVNTFDFDVVPGGNAALSDVRLTQNPIRLDDTGAKLNIRNGFGGAISMLAADTTVLARGTQTWTNGTLSFAALSGAQLLVANDPPALSRNRGARVAGATLTLDSTFIIAGGGGARIANDPTDTVSPPAAILDKGELRADVIGQTLRVDVAGGFTVHGTARAKNGATLAFDTMPANYNSSTSTLTGGTWEAQANSSLTFASGIAATGTGTTFSLIGVGASIPALINLATNGGTIQLSTNTSLNHIGAVTNNGTLNVVSGTLDVGGTLDGSGSAIISNAGTLKTTRVRQTGLQIFGGKVFISANGSPQFVNVLSSIQFNGNGLIDLADNDLILQPTDPNAPWLANVEFNVNRGRNAGAWNGLGIQSSAAAAAVTAGAGNKALGVLAASQYLESNGDPSFDGIVLGGSEVLVKYTYYGDVDFNGRVDASDYNLIDYGYVNHLTGWAWGDVDGNHAVDASDYNLIDFAFTTQNGVL